MRQGPRIFILRLNFRCCFNMRVLREVVLTLDDDAGWCSHTKWQTGRDLSLSPNLEWERGWRNCFGGVRYTEIQPFYAFNCVIQSRFARKWTGGAAVSTILDILGCRVGYPARAGRAFLGPTEEQTTSIALLHGPLGGVDRFDAAAEWCSLNLNRTVQCSVE